MRFHGNHQGSGVLTSDISHAYYEGRDVVPWYALSYLLNFYKANDTDRVFKRLVLDLKFSCEREIIKVLFRSDGYFLYRAIELSY